MMRHQAKGILDVQGRKLLRAEKSVSTQKAKGTMPRCATLRAEWVSWYIGNTAFSDAAVLVRVRCLPHLVAALLVGPRGQKQLEHLDAALVAAECVTSADTKASALDAMHVLHVLLELQTLPT